MNLTTYMKIRMDLDDAEDFIKDRIEASMDCKAIVSIEPRITQFELFPCLAAAQNAYTHSVDTKVGSPGVEAIKALRTAAKERGMDLSLADCKSVVEAFIKI